MHSLIGLTALNVAFLAAGYGVLAAAGRRVDLRDAGLALCAGLAAVGIACCLAAIAGWVPGWKGAVVIAAALAAPAVRRRPQLRGWRRRRPAVAALVPLGFGLAAALYSIALLRLSTVDRLDEYDAWAMWTMKAKALIVYGDLKTAIFTGAHPDYPPLVPMLQSLVFRFVGAYDTQIVHVEYAVLVLAFVAAAGRLLAYELPVAAVAAWALFMLVLPGFARNVPDALGDVPVAIFVALALLSLISWLREERAVWAVLFSLFGAAACWTKNEGGMAMVAVSIVAVVIQLGRPRRALWTILGAIGAVAALAFLWREWSASVGAHYDTNLAAGLRPSFLAAHGSELPRAFDAIWGQIGSIDRWAGLPFLAFVLAVVGIVLRGEWRLALLAVVAPALMVTVYAWVYVVRNDPLGFGWEVATSASRIVTTVGLALAVLVPVQAAVFLREPRRREDAR
jgi:hypothetical protein